MAIGFQVVFDAADPDRQAAFWAFALSYEVQPPPPGFASWEAFAREIGVPEDRWHDLAAVVDPDGAAPRVLFQRVPEGKTVKNRVHLDVSVSATATDPRHGWELVVGHAEKLLAAGATMVREVNETTGRCLVLTDPEGNEFCVQ